MEVIYDTFDPANPPKLPPYPEPTDEDMEWAKALVAKHAGTSLTAAALLEIELGYNPDQPRDDHGRWGSGAGESQRESHGAGALRSVTSQSEPHQVAGYGSIKGFGTAGPLVQSVRRGEATEERHAGGVSQYRVGDQVLTVTKDASGARTLEAHGPETADTRFPGVSAEAPPAAPAPTATPSAAPSETPGSWTSKDVFANPQDQKVFDRVVGSKSLNFGSSYSYEPERSPKLQELEDLKSKAFDGIGARLGYTQEQVDAGKLAMKGSLDGWRMTGGRNINRDSMDAAWEKIRSGETPETALERGMVMQRAYTEAVLNSHYGAGDSEIPVTRFVQDTYAEGVAIQQHLGESGAVQTWPLTSWGVPEAADAIDRRWIRGSYAVQMNTTVPRNDVLLAVWGEAAFRTSELKAPGELIVG